MPTIRMHETTTSTPEQFIAALTDFGPGRAKIFPNTSDKELQVHHLGTTDADVTEGTTAVWERLHYDWSDPNRVVMTTIDSNVWGGNSGHIYTLTRNPDGTTAIDAVSERDGKNVEGHLLGLLLESVGRHSYEKAFTHSVRAIEARNAEPPSAPRPGAPES